MSYRPYIGNTQLDPGLLTGAIAGIGSLFGKGKLTATQVEDPVTKRPIMQYATSGGDFWDNINGGQAQKANLATQGLGFKTDMDLYQDKGRLNNQLGFNSQDRIGQFNDKAKIAQMIQSFAGNANPALAAMSIEQENQLDQAKAMQEVIRRGYLAKQLQADMEKQAILNQGNILANTGLDTENQFRAATNPYRSMQLKAQGENADALLKSQIAENNARMVAAQQPGKDFSFYPGGNGSLYRVGRDPNDITLYSQPTTMSGGIPLSNMKDASGNPVVIGGQTVPDRGAPLKAQRLGSGTIPSSTSNTNKISGDKVARALKILRGEE